MVVYAWPVAVSEQTSEDAYLQPSAELHVSQGHLVVNRVAD